jgi:3'-5' exoribonuclease
MAADARMSVSELVEGQLVDSTFAVLRKDRRRTRTGSPYLALELADRTGRVRATVFDDAPILDGRFEAGDVVRVLGSVESFRGRPQIVVRSLERVEAEADALDFVPGARRDVDDLEGFLEFLVEEIPDAPLRELAAAVFADEPLRVAFRAAPMSVEHHHAYAGGALQHTVAVATACRELALLQPRLDPSVVGCASLLFAVGAADAFVPGPVLQSSEEGRLLGIPRLSARRIERTAERLATPRERVVAVLHCVDADQQRTPEAACLHGAIDLDAAVSTALARQAGRAAAAQ